jgi:hypothetical protein
MLRLKAVFFAFSIQASAIVSGLFLVEKSRVSNVQSAIGLMINDGIPLLTITFVRKEGVLAKTRSNALENKLILISLEIFRKWAILYAI